MIKRRKDGGFTLIELMIVIAVIGILAVVLAPKMAGVKDSAKYAGVTTNAKSVEAFVIANIERWTANQPATNVDNIILGQFNATPANDNNLKNPLGSGAAIIVAIEDSIVGGGTVADGTIYVNIKHTSNKLDSIDIIGYGDIANSDIVYQTSIKSDGTFTTP